LKRSWGFYISETAARGFTWLLWKIPQGVILLAWELAFKRSVLEKEVAYQRQDLSVIIITKLRMAEKDGASPKASQKLHTQWPQAGQARLAK
jgi:hypothetical protein